MAKKKSDIMENERTAFIAGADQNGVPRDISEMIYSEIAKFSSYAFNKSHSVAYAYLAYRTAYLKCRFSSDYMAAFISGSFSQAAINETRRLGLRFLRPDINISPRKCVAEDEKSIRFGLALVKGMGTHPVDAVMTEREKLPFFSLEDFCGRFDSYTVPQNAIENLITAGAFDSFGKSRRQMLRFLPEIMDTARRDRQKAESGQQSLFGEENETIEKTANKAALPEFDDREKHRMEIAVCGISFDN
jgi:DNA polymerase-3 subunit alpha